MKSEKGITLTSLTIYIIGMLIILGIMSVITRNFYGNMSDIIANVNPATEYTKFNSYFSNEVNQYNIKVLECKNAENDEGQSYIVFDNGVQYTFVPKNRAIYHNNIKVCRLVQKCTFSTGIQNGNDIVTINMTIDGKKYENTYTFKK